jgi:alpha/beta superfamily hydrolase
MDFNGLSPQTRVGLMVCGRLDQIAPPDMAVEIGRNLDVPITPRILDDADHFLNGYEDQLADIIADHLNGQTG